MVHVKLDTFEGPLDLLLHLIKKNEINIHDIPVAKLTQEYLACIELMQTIDLEIASEFLVMAAYLLWLKSAMLLPRHVDGEDKEIGEDPRAFLAKQLMEYKAYKEAVENLKAHWLEHQDVYTKNIVDDGDEGRTIPINSFNLFDLLDAFRRLLARQKIDVSNIPLPYLKISIADKMKAIEEKLTKIAGIWFVNLFDEMVTKDEIIVTFLSILELIRRERILVRQKQNFSKIWIQLR